MKRLCTPKLPEILIAALLAVAPAVLRAEQMQSLGPYDVHYVVVQSTFFSEDIASRYQIVRGRDRALLNISVLDGSGKAVRAKLEGTITNLLSQVTPIDFREVAEGPAIYYLAEVKHTDRETLRFLVTITAEDGIPRQLRFQQQMFWDDA